MGDKLNGKYKQHQQHNPWAVGTNTSRHMIFKLLLYLQDHTKNDEGLRVLPGSHLEPEIVLRSQKYLQLHPAIGDAVIIDQRVTHTGQSQVTAPPHRILVSVGFGAQNARTADFERGTTA